MRRNYSSVKSAAKAAWLTGVTNRVVKANPAMAGKMDWDTATYLYNSGKSMDEAADALLKAGSK